MFAFLVSLLYFLFYYLSIIWLSQGQLWATYKEKPDSPNVNHSAFTNWPGDHREPPNPLLFLAEKQKCIH